MPTYILILSTLAMFISCFCGHFLELYLKSTTFDRYLHVYGSIAFSLLTFCIIRSFITVGGSKLFLSLFIFTIGNTLGCIFELIEAISDTKGKSKSQKGLIDTDTDMLANLIGFGIAAVIGFFWLV